MRGFSRLAIAAVLATGCSDSPSRQCEVAPAPGAPFALVPGGAATQIHAALGFDGAQVWLGYNLPDDEGSGGFDTFARRLACDGTTIDRPIQLTTTLGGNDVDPDLAIADSTVAFAWSSDDGSGGGANLRLMYRAVDLDGAPLTANDVTLVTSYQGEPLTANILFPKLAPLPGGDFAIGAVRAHPETSTFQAFAQRLAADGTLIGEAIDPALETGSSFSAPSIAANPSGAVQLAWANDPTGDQPHVTRARVLGDWSGFDRTIQLETISSAPNLAYADDGFLLTAYGNEVDDLVLTAGDSEVSFGAAGRLDHSPNIAIGPGGGVVGYHRVISGLQNEVVVQPFGWDGSTLTLGSEIVLATEPAAPYQVAITHVEDGVYLVAWSQGTSPDFYLYGMFVAP